MSDIKADLILHNARVITLDQTLPAATMVAVKGNSILAVGGEHEVELFSGADTSLIDCECKAVIPGFNDSHCHPLSLAMTLLHLDCSSAFVRNISEIQALICEQANSTAKSKWIRAAKYNESNLAEKRHPTRWELDEAAPGNPVILIHDSAKSCVLNSVALRQVGITEDSSDPPAGHLGRDDVTGQLNGMITGRNEQVENGIPPLDQEDIQQGIKLANQDYLSHGITSLCDTTWSNTTGHWDFLRKIKESGELSPRVTMMAGTNAVTEFQERDLHTGSGDDQLRVGATKIALDESTGCAHPPQDELNDHALRAHRAGFQLAFHVHDIQTLQGALASLQFIVQNDPTPYSRPRLEHCGVCPPALISKLRTFEVIVATQPCFLYYLGETYRREVTAEQLTWLYPLRSFSSQGVITTTSSDSPLFPCNPLIGIYTAVTRKDKCGQTISPEESVSSPDALRMYTLWPAYASFEEKSKGSISPGKLADLVVLSDDPTEVEPERIRDISAMLTIINGHVIWTI